MATEFDPTEPVGGGDLVMGDLEAELEGLHEANVRDQALEEDRFDDAIDKEYNDLQADTGKQKTLAGRQMRRRIYTRRRTGIHNGRETDQAMQGATVTQTNRQTCRQAGRGHPH